MRLPTRRRPREALGSFPGRSAACLVAGLVSAFMASPRASQTPQRTLVVPFENTDRVSRLYWVSEAAAVLVTERLQAAGQPTITREDRLRAFERLGVPATAPLSRATIIKIAQLVGADAVVLGSFRLAEDELAVRARHIVLVSGRMESEIAESGVLTDIVRIFDRVGARLTPSVAVPPPAAEDPPPLAALEPYVKGLLAETPAGQVKYLVTALGLDPSYDSARLALWQAYTADGDHERALKAVLAVPETSRVIRRAQFLAALSELRLARYDEALTRLSSLAGEVPSATVFNNLGVVLLRRAGARPGQAARDYFAKALEADPEDPDYRFNLGYASWLDRDLAAAASALREAVRRDPTDGDAHFVLGTALLASGANAEGTRERDLALRLSSLYAEWAQRPAADPVPRGLERVKEDLEPSRVFRSAQAFVRTEQRDQQELAAFHLDRGRRLFVAEQDQEAVEELRRSLYLLPYQAEAHLLLGRIYLRSGRVREAIDTLKIALWSEETAEGHVALGEALWQAREVAAARAEAERALALAPGSAEARRLLEKIVRQDGAGPLDERCHSCP